MPTKAVAAAAVVALFCLASPAASFEVEGHRGARWARPENTLAAFRYALALGVDTLEMDVHATKDDVLVVTHDPLLNPDQCLDPDGKRIASKILIRSLTIEELQRYDCGSLINPRFKEQVPQPKERIPTFEEVLTWLDTSTDPRARKVHLNVEIKSEAAHPEYTPAPEPFTRLVLETARRHRLRDRFILQSFDYRTLEAAKKLAPETILSALVEDRPTEPLAALAKRVHADIVSPNYEWLTAEDVAGLHAAGVKVVPWTANTPEVWKKLVELGVDGIISDDPKALLEFRKGLEPAN